MATKRTPLGDLERELQDPEFAKLYGAEQAKSEFAIILYCARAHCRRAISQKELANSLGRNQSYITALEEGKANPPLGHCGSLLATMGYRLKMSLAPLVKEAE